MKEGENLRRRNITSGFYAYYDCVCNTFDTVSTESIYLISWGKDFFDPDLSIKHLQHQAAAYVIGYIKK